MIEDQRKLKKNPIDKFKEFKIHIFKREKNDDTI